jgi:hypothetical protein
MSVNTIFTVKDVKDISDKKRVNIKKGQYPKDKGYYESIKYIKKINNSNPHLSLLPVPLKPNSKRPAEALKTISGEEIRPCILYASSHPEEKRWCEDKLKEWTTPMEDSYGNKHPPCVEMDDYGLGVMIGKGVGCLDFDCQKDYEWFINKFTSLNLKNYPVVQGSGHHNCQCPIDNHKTYHIYFQKTDHWIEATTLVNCIYEDYENNELRRKIDYLRCSPDNTPHIVALPTGNGKKIWVNKSEGLIPLPPDIGAYFKANWIYTADKKLVEAVGANKYIDLFKCIPPISCVVSKFIRMVIELKGQRIADSVIIEASKSLRRTDLDRVGAGIREYTMDEHCEWVQGIIKLYDPLEHRMSIHTIVQLANDTNIDASNSIHRKDLALIGTEFNIQKIGDIGTYEADINTRMRLISRYYNHFCVITSCDRVSNEPRRLLYNRVGKLINIRIFKNMREFVVGHDIKVTLNGQKPESACKWWMENYQRYEECLYNPRGILDGIHNQDPRKFNSFTGFRMNYVDDYKGSEKLDILGDRIHTHMKEVMSYNEDSPGKMDIYDFIRKWMYTHICLGKRPNVALVFYSPELGTGKSFFCSGYADFVVGRSITCQVSRFEQLLKDQFTDGYEDKSLMVVEELPENSYKNKAGWDFFKTFITDNEQASRKIYTAAATTTIHCPIIMNTNHIYAVDGDAASRRILCVRVSNKYVNDTKYWGNLWECANYPAWENYFHRYVINKHYEFSDVDISPSENTIPMTKYKRNILSRSTDSVMLFINDFLQLTNMGTEDDMNHTGIYGKMWHIEEMFKEWKSYCNRNHHEAYIKNTYEFKKKLQDRFEIKIISIDVILDEPTPIEPLSKRKDIVKLARDNKGHYMVFTEQLVKRLSDMCKKKARGASKSLEVSENVFNNQIFSISQYVDEPGFIDDLDD